MDRDAAIKLLKSGQTGVAQWHRQWAQTPKHTSADFAGVDFAGDDLSGVNLSGDNLSRADLNGTNLNGARLIRANLSGANLSKARLHGADLSEAELVGADLSGADLSSAVLIGANLSKAQLHRANLSEAKLGGANLSHADLQGANLASATCDYVQFIGTRGLYGRHRIRLASPLEGDDDAIYSYRWDQVSWGLIRTVGSLPLFGISYFGIFSIWLWASGTEYVNRLIRSLKQPNVPDDLAWLGPWLDGIPYVPLPGYMGYTLTALLLLAIAATLYKLFCPGEVQESSETRWVVELNQPVIFYRALSYRHLLIRWASALCYGIGGPWVLYLLARRISETVWYVFTAAPA
jgi:hypothetical protein